MLPKWACVSRTVQVSTPGSRKIKIKSNPQLLGIVCKDVKRRHQVIQHPIGWSCTLWPQSLTDSIILQRDCSWTCSRLCGLCGMVGHPLPWLYRCSSQVKMTLYWHQCNTHWRSTRTVLVWLWHHQTRFQCVNLRNGVSREYSNPQATNHHDPPLLCLPSILVCFKRRFTKECLTACPGTCWTAQQRTTTCLHSESASAHVTSTSGCTILPNKNNDYSLLFSFIFTIIIQCLIRWTKVTAVFIYTSI